MVKMEEALSLIPHIEFGFIVKEKSECEATKKKKKKLTLHIMVPWGKNMGEKCPSNVSLK